MIPVAVSCPTCGRDLMDDSVNLDGNPSIRVNFKLGEEKGELHLSSIYGSFRYLTEVKVGAGDVTDLYCPHCNALLNTDRPCGVCGAPLAHLKLEVDGEVFFCSRRGCKTHNIELRDLEGSLERMYGRLRKDEVK